MARDVDGLFVVPKTREERGAFMASLGEGRGRARVVKVAGHSRVVGEKEGEVREHSRSRPRRRDLDE